MRALTALPAFDDNYIWLYGPPAATVVVDPGDAGPVLAAVSAGLRLAGVLITHHHPDHIGGLAELLAATGAPCWAPDDARIAVDTAERVGEGARVGVGAVGFDVLAVPGHTRSHIAFVGDDVLFCGDTLFSLGCGRLFEGTPEQMLGSLDRLAALPGTLRVCCAHEYTQANGRFALAVDPDNAALHARLAEVARLRAAGRPSLPSTLADERASNPFLRSDTPAIAAAVAGPAGNGHAARVERFARLRRMKDAFRG